MERRGNPGGPGASGVHGPRAESAGGREHHLLVLADLVPGTVYARLFRQGQKAGTVVIIHIVTKDTMDGDVLKALAEKERVQDALIDAVRAQIAPGCHPGRSEGSSHACHPERSEGSSRNNNQGGTAA